MFSKIQELQDWINVVKDENCRRELIVRGETFAKLFLSYRRNHAVLHNKRNNEKEEAVKSMSDDEIKDESNDMNETVVNMTSIINTEVEINDIDSTTTVGDNNLDVTFI